MLQTVGAFGSLYEVVNSTSVKQAWMAPFSRSFKLRFGAVGLPRTEARN